MIANETFRSRYEFLEGLARHMRDDLPYASFVGRTNPPIELKDANTRPVFDDYLDSPVIKQAMVASIVDVFQTAGLNAPHSGVLDAVSLHGLQWLP